MKKNNAAIKALEARYQAARSTYLLSVQGIAEELSALGVHERTRYDALSEAAQESDKGVDFEEYCESLEVVVDELKLQLDVDEVFFDDLLDLAAPLTT